MSSRPPIPEGPYLIVGLARSGVAAARVLSERGARSGATSADATACAPGAAAAGAPGGRVVGVDAGAPPPAVALTGLGVELHLHDDGLAHLDGVRTVIKSPGVPAQAPAIEAARARGIPVLGELEL